MITWTETLSTVVDELDTQHKILIKKFNELSEALLLPGVDREVAESVLDYLQFYADWSFAEEEAYMKQVDYPGAAANQLAHAEFRSLFGAFYQRWRTSNMSSAHALEIHHALENWIIKHIFGVDAGLRPYLQETANEYN